MTDNATLVKAIIEGAQEKKGRGIVTVDMHEIEMAAAEGFVIVNGNTPIQVNAIADSIREYVENIIDYGTIYAHVFLPDFRERYKLEELWADAVIEEIPDLD